MMAQVIKGLIDIFHFMIYDHEIGITHESASAYFQHGPFYWVDVHVSSPSITGEINP